MEWIKCEEQMPSEEIKECLVVNNGMVCFACHGFNHYGKHYFEEPYENVFGSDLDNVTHWMPLPTPPCE